MLTIWNSQPKLLTVNKQTKEALLLQSHNVSQHSQQVTLATLAHIMLTLVCQTESTGKILKWQKFYAPYILTVTSDPAHFGPRTLRTQDTSALIYENKTSLEFEN